MKVLYSKVGKEIEKQLQETPLENFEKYIGQLVLNTKRGSDLVDITKQEVGFLLTIDFSPRIGYTRALIHKLSQDTCAFVMYSIHPYTTEVTIQVVTLKVTEDMMPLFRAMLIEDDIRCESDAEEDYSEYTLSDMSPALLLVIAETEGLRKLAEGDAEMVSKFGHLKEKISIEKYTNRNN